MPTNSELNLRVSELDLKSLEEKMGKDEVGDDPELELFQQSLRNREQLCRQWGRAITTYNIQEIEFQFRKCVGNRYAYSEQNSSVDKYYWEFCEWKRWMVILYGWEDSAEVVVGIFVRGLKKTIKNEMPSPLPLSLNQAYLEVIAIELRLRRRDPWVEKKSDVVDLNPVDPNPLQNVAELGRKVQMHSVKVKEKNQLKKSKSEKVGDLEEVFGRVEDPFGNKVSLEDPSLDSVNWILKYSPVIDCDENGMQNKFNNDNRIKESQNLIIILNTLDDFYDWWVRSEIETGVVGNEILFVSKDSENFRNLAYRDSINLLKEDSVVIEETLVRNELYACQGIHGKHFKFEKISDESVLNGFTKVPTVFRVKDRQLCELDWLFKKVKSYISNSIDWLLAKDVGTVGHTNCAALPGELFEGYKLMVALELQSVNRILLVLEAAGSRSYSLLKRLSMCFAKPMVKMRVLDLVVDICRVLSGGKNVGAVKTIDKLEAISNIALGALKDLEQMVRGAAPFALDQLIEHLPSEIISHCERVLPCNLKVLEASNDVQEKLYYAEKVLELKKNLMVLKKDEDSCSQAKATELVKMAAISVRKTRMEPIRPPFIEAGFTGFELEFNELQIEQPMEDKAKSEADVFAIAIDMGYPAVGCPSHVLCGRTMYIIYNDEKLVKYLETAVKVDLERPVLVDKYLYDAIEIDNNAVADSQGNVVIGRIMKHIEQSGVHSSDSTCSIPIKTIPLSCLDIIQLWSTKLEKRLNVRCLMNCQNAISAAGEVFLLKINPRASRTAPFVPKSIERPLAAYASLVMSGPEMHSTGEVMDIDYEFLIAFAKAQFAVGQMLPTSGTNFLRDLTRPHLATWEEWRVIGGIFSKFQTLRQGFLKGRELS